MYLGVIFLNVKYNLIYYVSEFFSVIKFNLFCISDYVYFALHL